MKYADFGTVSHGTLRDADLLRSLATNLNITSSATPRRWIRTRASGISPWSKRRRDSIPTTQR